MVLIKKNILLSIFISLILQSCNSRIPETPPNIVWITSEDNSVHYMKLYDPDGAPTPNIARLAEEGVLCRNAFSNGPVCSVARSTIISGCYAPGIGAQYHRKIQKAPMPEGLQMFPAYLRQAGYYTTNNSKEDYNIVKNENVWDESSREAHWKNRTENQPFFHVFNIGTTHESRLHFTQQEMEKHETKTPLTPEVILPEHPKTELFEYTNAFYRDKIMQMDTEVGAAIQELEEAGLMENTFIFYYGDHGGVLPGSKGYLYETGLHVPMVVYVPEKYSHLVDFDLGSEIDGFVEFTDLAPTVLNLAGLEIPDGMDGKPFLGKNIKSKEVDARDETLGYADRFDEKYDMVRTLRKGKYKYIRSFQPFNFDGLQNNYRYIQLAFQEWRTLFHEGELNDVQSRFFETRPPEMLFDLANDPHETTNLADDPAFSEILADLRSRLNERLSVMPDLSFFPEHAFLEEGIANPVKFGNENSNRIRHYLEIANLQLETQPVSALLEALNSDDPWDRYWALISCSSLKSDSKKLIEKAKQITADDSELLNRVRAAEYLAIATAADPVPVMTSSLYKSKNSTEALLILNSIVLMRDGKYNFDFKIDPLLLNKEVAENDEVQRRIKYLTS